MSISSSFRLLPPKIPTLLHPKSPIIKTLILQSPQFPSNPTSHFSISIQKLPTTKLSSSSSSSPSPLTSSSLQPIEDLPPKLQEIIKLFQTVTEPKAKYEQLLFYGKKLIPLDTQFKTNENKVQGCVSQVWVRAYLDQNKNVLFEADSDSVLTKGLAALLVQGLSGRPVDEILRVSPDFVTLMGLKQSLTPSRNNGFLNMLRLMQNKALMLYKEDEEGVGGGGGGGLVENEGLNEVESGIGTRVSSSEAKAGESDVKNEVVVESGLVKNEGIEVESGIGTRVSSSDANAGESDVKNEVVVESGLVKNEGIEVESGIGTRVSSSGAKAGESDVKNEVVVESGLVKNEGIEVESGIGTRVSSSDAKAGESDVKDDEDVVESGLDSEVGLDERIEVESGIGTRVSSSDAKAGESDVKNEGLNGRIEVESGIGTRVSSSDAKAAGESDVKDDEVVVVESGLDSEVGLGSRGERIKAKLKTELKPVELDIEDISYQHAGHAGVRGSGDGETHFNVRIVSEEFDGKSLVKRHRLVYDLLREELESGLHALSIVAKTPAEVR